jgi:SAM-dependent methyltransferase
MSAVGFLDRLRTPEGAALLAEAAELDGRDPLAAASALRRRGHPPDLAAAALTQARLRQRAVAKFGPDAVRMFFTADGLEQATRSAVAARRAARFTGAEAAGGGAAGRVADLCCGIGADLIALARAGLTVTGVERDPATAAIAAANVAALGLTASVRCADATAYDLSGVDAVFCDPARRTGGRRVFDPSAYAPPWSFLLELARRIPRTGVKVAPGIDHALVPPGAEAEWVSVDGDVVEAALWFGDLAGARHRATVLRGGAARELTGSGERRAAAGPVRRYLYDPDGAVVRAHLVAEFADLVDGSLLDETIAYVSSDRLTATPFARAYEVTDVLPFSEKRLRALLAARGVGRVTIKKRGSAILPEDLRRRLKLRGDAEATVILTRLAGAPTMLLCAPVPS